MGDIATFQMDLRNGMSITDALKKHGFTLQEALDKVNPIAYVPAHERKRNPDMKNISHRRGGNYSVRKKFNGSTRTYGTYSNLHDAILVRDYFDENGWDLLDVGLVCALMGIKRIKKQWSE